MLEKTCTCVPSSAPFETVTHLVVSQVDETISQAVRVLADWLELKITYTREGSIFKFRYEKPGSG